MVVWICVERAAPQPASGGQVGIAFLALSARTVARRAIVAEGGLALREREFEHLGICGDLR